MQHIHLHRGHSIYISLEDIQRDEVPAGIDQQTPPCKPGFIFDRHHRDWESICAGFYQLQKCLKAVQNPEGVRRCESRVWRAHRKLVRLILTNFPHRLAAVIGAYQKDGTIFFRGGLI